MFRRCAQRSADVVVVPVVAADGEDEIGSDCRREEEEEEQAAISNRGSRAAFAVAVGDWWRRRWKLSQTRRAHEVGGGGVGEVGEVEASSIIASAPAAERERDI